MRRTDGLNVGPYEQPSPEARRPLRVRLNIVNMMKKNSLYALGMLPVGFCERADARRGYGWTRVGEDVCYFRNTRTYPKRCRGPDVGKEGRFSGTGPYGAPAPPWPSMAKLTSLGYSSSPSTLAR